MDKILASRTALELAKQVLTIEAEAIQGLAARLGQSFLDAVALLLNCKGRVIVSGIGKSGHIARKIASTMASTGTPAYFVHPAEASHGDIGMIARDDVLIALSNSGESEELLTILPLLKRQGAPHRHHRQCQFGAGARSRRAPGRARRQGGLSARTWLRPPAPPRRWRWATPWRSPCSTPKGFGAEDFARSHPGGALGRRLLTHVRDVMRSGDDIPWVSEATGFSEALLEMSKKRMGMTAVLDATGRVSGVFTDGDLRRTLAQVDDIRAARIADIMTRGPRTIGPDKLAVEAVQIMEERKVNQLLVVSDEGKLVGALNMHDLFRAKVI